MGFSKGDLEMELLVKEQTRGVVLLVAESDSVEFFVLPPLDSPPSSSNPSNNVMSGAETVHVQPLVGDACPELVTWLPVSKPSGLLPMGHGDSTLWYVSETNSNSSDARIVYACKNDGSKRVSTIGRVVPQMVP